MKIKNRLRLALQSVASIFERKRSHDLRMYAHMFLEDVYIGILPYEHHDTPSFSVRLSGGDRNAEIELCEAIERHSRRDLKEGFTDFIRETSKALTYHGKIYYRILYTGEERPRFDLIRLYKKDVWSFWGWHFIIKRPSDRKRKPEAFRWGPTICFKLPTRYRCLPTLVRRMSKINPTGLPIFALDQYHPESPKSHRIPVDFNVIKDSEEYKLGRMTRHIGWTGRHLLSERMTEYYYLHRELLYKKFLIEMREQITSDLNKVLGHLSEELKFPSLVLVESLPTLDEISTSQKMLKSGAATFAEIMKPFLLKASTE